MPHMHRVSKELRQKLVKMAKAQAEKTKVGIRKARQKGITEIKRKSDVSKDTVRKLEKHVCIPKVSTRNNVHCIVSF